MVRLAKALALGTGQVKAAARADRLVVEDKSVRRMVSELIENGL